MPPSLPHKAVGTKIAIAYAPAGKNNRDAGLFLQVNAAMHALPVRRITPEVQEVPRGKRNCIQIPDNFPGRGYYHTAVFFVPYAGYLRIITAAAYLFQDIVCLAYRGNIYERVILQHLNVHYCGMST